MKSFDRNQFKILFLSSLGGVLEFYDFIIYIFLAPILEKVFFVNNTNFVATLKTLAIFSIGYLLRPLGGIVFSHFGDRYGRKVVFLLTVILMALPSFAIGLLPITAQIGIAAPILLLIFRMMQGLALGGEIPAAITFVSEHVNANQRGFSLAVLFFGINTGILLGSLVTTLLMSLLPVERVIAYGWRIPFLIGGVFGIISIYLRGYLHETQAFKALRQQDLRRVPIFTLMRNSYKQVVLGMMLVATGSVTVFFYLYWPQYLSQNMHYDFAQMMRLNTVSMMVLSIFIIVGGFFVDKVGPRVAYLVPTSLLIIFSYPLFALFNMQSIYLVIISYMIFSIIFGLIPSAYSSILSSLFPTATRYSGIALSYNLAYAFLGGLSPIICTVVIKVFDSVLAPAFYIMAIAAVSWIACYLSGRRTSEGLLDLGYQKA